MKHFKSELLYYSPAMSYHAYRRTLLDMCIIHRNAKQYLELMRTQKQLARIRFPHIDD